MLAGLAGDRGITDVGVDSARGLVGAGRSGVRRHHGSLALDSGQFQGEQAMDVTGGSAASRHRSASVVRSIRNTVLQCQFPGAQGGSKAASLGSGHEASESRLGSAEAVTSHGGAQWIPPIGDTGGVAPVVGSIGIVFPPDVASRYDKVLRCGGPERSLRKVPSLPVRLGAVNVRTM